VFTEQDIDDHAVFVNGSIHVALLTTASAAAFFRQAIERTGVIPNDVVTDHHQPYINAIATTCPGARHIRTGLHRARGETTTAIREIAEVIGRHLDVPVVSISPNDAAEHFTWLAGSLGVDSPASSVLTRELLGWQPTHTGLIDDLDQGHYFHN
jgi:hypothetical protein